MKRVLIVLKVILILVLVGCSNQKTDSVDLLSGKWKKVTDDGRNLVLEITKPNEWKYFVDDKAAEEGTYVLEGNKFIMKHKTEEHDHAEGEDHGHEHYAPEDHIYEYMIDKDGKELKLTHGAKVSVFARM